jgi:hypothetical protein
MFITSPESCLLFMPFIYMYTIISILKIKLNENFRSHQLIKGLINKGKRVSIFYRDFVKSMIIDTKSEATILLWNEEDRGPSRAYIRPDLTLVDRILQV